MNKVYLKDTQSLQGEVLDGEFVEVFRGEYVLIVRDGGDIYEILFSEVNEVLEEGL